MCVCVCVCVCVLVYWIGSLLFFQFEISSSLPTIIKGWRVPRPKRWDYNNNL